MDEELLQKVGEIDILEDNDGPSEKRWDPVGANNGDEDYPLEFKESYCLKRDTIDRLEMMEQEQEMLNSSLISLTTHFAQVQFRLKQIVNSPSEIKEELLKELEEFAFRGIPDIQSNLVFNASLYPSFNHTLNVEDSSLDKDLDLKIKLQRNKQKELICQLKTQLEDLENYAYETGDADLPQSIVLERQNLVINHLKEKLNFNLEDLSKLSGDDFRWKVDCAINQIVSPLKMKEQLINQLKTQITDLERFINYLQGEVSIETLACTCACPVHTSGKTATNFKSHRKYKSHSNMENNTSLSTIRKVVALLHMYIMSQIGYENQNSKNKKSTVAYSWRDLRTRLDISIEHVLETIAGSSCKDSTNKNINYNSDSDTPVPLYDIKVTSAVRKHLTICLRDLMQHGCTRDANSISLVPFAGCFVSKNNVTSDSMHAWEIIIKYYEIKNGYRYNSSPAQKLSQSFNLDLTGKQNTSAKQNLLITIGNIIAIHSPYKRSLDSNFKAFVCAALNSKKLVVWLKFILQNQYILENFYMPWSYTIKTGFQDALHALDKLTSHNFDLPVDLAIQQFQNIKEAF